jgi:hypothetical protein
MTGAPSITAGEANDSLRGVLGSVELVEALPCCRARPSHVATLELAVNSEICLGCGTEYVGDCEACYQRLSRCLNVFAHWPMETSMTPAALAHVEAAIREYLDNDRAQGVEPKVVEAELVLCASHIRAYLQHVAAGLRVFKHEPTDEELLS